MNTRVFEVDRTVVVIDSSISDYQSLVQGIDPQASVVLLSSEQDGVTQITQALGKYQDIESLHILSHGSSGRLRLGNVELSLETLETYKEQFQQWKIALGQTGKILLYGCCVAAGEHGRNFVDGLAQLTGANIAASQTLTGSSSLGGNWSLEVTTGEVNQILPFRSEVLRAYTSVLILLVDETFVNADLSFQPPFDDQLRWIFGTGTTSDTPSDLENPFLTARPDRAPQEGGIPGVPAGFTPDLEGAGALRLTSNASEQAGFVIYDFPVRSDAGLKLEFEFFAYGGTGDKRADGISFFLIDGDASPTTSGGFGGSLGYAPRIDQGKPGLEGGYLGIGFDAFGNFANPRASEGRIGGPGSTPDAITIRGSEADGYDFITTTGVLPIGIDTDVNARNQESRRTVEILLTQDGLLSVSLDLDFDQVIEPNELLINNLDVKADNGDFPETFKFGFAGSTGTGTNFHELRSVRIQTLQEPPVLDLDRTTTPGVNFETGFTEGQDPVAIANQSLIEDADDDTLEVATIRLTNPLDGSLESIGFNEAAQTLVDQLGLTVNADGTTIEINGSASLEDYEAIIDGIVYNNASINPTTTPRTVEVIVRDKAREDGFNSDLAIATIAITDIPNELPETEDVVGNFIRPTDVQVPLLPLQGSDADGFVTGFRITQLPTQGTLFLDGTPLELNAVVPADRAGDLTFTPSPEPPFNFALFQFAAIDNEGGEDPTPATYIIPSIANFPPVADKIFLDPVNNQASQVPVIPLLNGVDVDGTVEQFSLKQLPSEGRLFFEGQPITDIDQLQAVEIEQATQLTFTPDSDFIGADFFEYIVTDNEGLRSLNTGVVTIPIVTGGIFNQRPTVENITVEPPVRNPAVPVVIPPLIGEDEDGTVEFFTIDRLSSNGQLLLAGQPVTGLGQVAQLTEAQSRQLTFLPNPNFTGTATFSYTATDDDNEQSLNPALIAIPTNPNQPPVATTINNPDILSNSIQVDLNSLIGSDSDGEVVGFRIVNFPLAGQISLNGEALIDPNQLIPISLADSLTFTSTPSFKGLTGFNYVAIDNENAVSNTAGFNIPVINRPPIVEDIFNSEIDVNQTQAPLSTLQGIDEDGVLVNFRVVDLPDNGQLFLGNQPITDTALLIPLDQADELLYSPNRDFVGTDNFRYVATDDDNAESLPGTFRIPIVSPIPANIPPETDDITAPDVSNRTAQPVSIPALSGSDVDGEVVRFEIQSLIPDLAGELFLAGEPVQLNEPVLIDQADQLTFQPNRDFVGEAVFTYAAIDNQGAFDLTPGTYTIPVFQGNLPPIADDITLDEVRNTHTVDLPALTGSDEDGTVEGFIITELALNGQLVLNGQPIQVDDLIDFEDAEQLEFIPDRDFVGEVTFQFLAVDNDDETSVEPGTVTIPLVANTPPIAESVTVPQFTNGVNRVEIPPLIATDPDGTIEGFTLITLPEVDEGTLFLAGVAVTDLSQVQNLSGEQASTLSFSPNPNFVGELLLGYFAIDNDGDSSNSVDIILNVTQQQSPPIDNNLAPIAEDLLLEDIPRDSDGVDVPALTATDPDGEVVSFDLISLLTPSEGELFLDGLEITDLSQVQDLTLDQADQLRFSPDSNPSEAEFTFTYQATDNEGAVSNVATVRLVLEDEDRGEFEGLCNFCSAMTITGITLPTLPFPLEPLAGNSVAVTLPGTEANDFLVGSDADEAVLGFGGNDILLAGGGNDNVLGNSGSDLLDGGDGNDFGNGGTANDVLFGSLGVDSLVGEAGNDTLFGGTNRLSSPDLAGTDLLTGGDGNDFLGGNENNDSLDGGADNDTLYGGRGEDLVYGNDGNDIVFGNLDNDTLVGDPGQESSVGGEMSQDTLFGNQGNDVMQGSIGSDRLYAGQGNDFGYGGKDNDELRGELGNDTLFGDLGDDTLFGDTNDSDQVPVGQDILLGGSGNDFIQGNRDTDTLKGGEGNDLIRGGQEDDLLSGEAGDDQLLGDRGNDELCGDAGNDTLFGDIGSDQPVGSSGSQDSLCGGAGNDLISGNEGQDLLCGDTGNDTLFGGKDNDTLVGGEGNDRLLGDLGNDTLAGGAGLDQFVLVVETGADVIVDFTDGEDVLELLGGLSFLDLTLEQRGESVVIQVGTELLVTLNQVSLSSITEVDFTSGATV
ncbi:MAG: DUF4347 domain-containing protein [Microcoleaceae cyanobacterium]